MRRSARRFGKTISGKREGHIQPRWSARSSLIAQASQYEASKLGVQMEQAETKKINEGKRHKIKPSPTPLLTYYDMGTRRRAYSTLWRKMRSFWVWRICEVHLKENPHYPGEGNSTSEPWSTRWPMSASTGGPNSKRCPTSVEDDMHRNLEFIRRLIASRNGG